MYRCLCISYVLDIVFVPHPTLASGYTAKSMFESVSSKTMDSLNMIELQNNHILCLVVETSIGLMGVTAP